MRGTEVNPRSSPAMILLVTVFVTDEASANQFSAVRSFQRSTLQPFLERGVKIKQACASSGTRVFVEEMSQMTRRQAEFRLDLDISGKVIRLASELSFAGGMRPMMAVAKSRKRGCCSCIPHSFIVGREVRRLSERDTER